MVRKFFILLLGLAALAGCNPARDPRMVRIPMMESFSGAAAPFSEDMWSGVVVAQDIINDRGGVHGRPVEFYKVDAPLDDIPTAIATFRRLARDPSIPLIFDGGATTVVVAVHGLANKFQAPLYAFASGGEWQLKQFNPWVFRSLPTAASASLPLIAEAKLQLGLRHAAILYPADDQSAVANARVFKNVSLSHGIAIDMIPLQSRQADYAPQVTRLKEIRPDALILTMQPFDAGLFVLQARNAGINAPVIGDVSILNEDYYRLAQGKVGRSVAYGVFDPNDPRPSVRTIIDAYEKRFGRAPSTWAMVAADGAMVTAAVLNKSSDFSRDSIRRAFGAPSGYENIGGRLTWNGSGDAVRMEAKLMRWTNDGRVIPVDSAFWKSAP